MIMVLDEFLHLTTYSTLSEGKFLVYKIANFCLYYQFFPICQHLKLMGHLVLCERFEKCTPGTKIHNNLHFKIFDL